MSEWESTFRAALLRLEEGGAIRQRWLPGMAAVVDQGAKGGRWRARRTETGWSFPSGAETENAVITRIGVPDVDDDATRGCLVALVREARRRPHAYFRPTAGGWQLADPDLISEGAGDPSEGRAAAEDLIRLATDYRSDS